MTDEGATWVGLLDMDDGGAIVGGSGPAPARHRQARVLIRTHRAPLGHVCVPTLPVETFIARVRTAAETRLAEALRRHARRDNLARELDGSCDWVDRAACPRHFATRNGAGVTIIVCSRDRTKELRRCLHALQQVT